MLQGNKSKIIGIIKNFIISIIIISIVYSIKMTIYALDVKKENAKDEIPRLKQEISELKNNLELQMNYIDWYKCMDSSKTDIDCFICDSIYNPNQEFVY